MILSISFDIQCQNRFRGLFSVRFFPKFNAGFQQIYPILRT